MHTLIVMLALVVGPQRDVIVDAVAVVELNHFYDDNAKLVFQQLIFYTWNGRESRYDVRAWALVKEGVSLPRYDVRRRLWLVEWIDGHALRSVRATSCRVSHTQFDPELVERAILPKERRLELTPIVPSAETVEALRPSTTSAPR